MRSRWRPLVAVCTCSALTLSGCAYSMISKGKIRQKPFDEMVHRTVLTRGIQPDRPIDAQVVRRSELDQILRQALRKEWSSSELRSYQQALNAVGLWPSDRDLADEYLGVLGEELAGFYLASERTLYVVADVRIPFWLRFFSALWRRDFLRETILAHELVHLLQHQAYPELMDPDPFYRSHDDLGLAIQAAFEGDATLYGIMAVGGGVQPAPGDLKKSIESDIGPQTRGRLADSPALIRLTLAFPYVEGYRLAYREGQALLKHPPASTEQVLHAEKRHEPFLALDLGPVVAALPNHCRFLHANTMGELGLSVLFRDLDGAVPRETWEGWDGDRYVVAECQERREFVWVTAWDSEGDAAEFESAYGDIAKAVAHRGALGAPPETERIGREVYVVTSGLAELRDALALLPRRKRVSEMKALREHFEVHSPAPDDDAPGLE